MEQHYSSYLLMNCCEDVKLTDQDQDIVTDGPLRKE
jgi:hypothetical protein